MSLVNDNVLDEIKRDLKENYPELYLDAFLNIEARELIKDILKKKHSLLLKDEERLEYGKCLPDEQKCKSCTRYPQCVRLVKCFNNRCTKENVDEWIWNTGNEMVWKYENKKTAP